MCAIIEPYVYDSLHIMMKGSTKMAKPNSKKILQKTVEKQNPVPAQTCVPKNKISDTKILETFKQYFDLGKGMPTIVKELGITLAELRARLRDAYKNNTIVFKPPTNGKLEQRLTEKWPNVQYHVLNARGEHFFRGSANVFFHHMQAVLERRDKEKPLRIGVVSGRTTGGMIEAMCNTKKSWGDLMPLDLLPDEICIYALNVSQLERYDQLKGNANVLAYELARRFTSEVKSKKVEAYGLSAALLQTKDEVHRTDCAPETRLLLKYTDPNRLHASLTALNKPVEEGLPKESQLDIVITGVGSIRDSLFKQYCEANGFDIDRLQAEQLIVGDIAYCPVTRTGEPRKLYDKDRRECEFYRAVSLEVLREMSSDPYKRVILVARNTRESNKTDPIHAAITKDAHFCNVFITDDTTAHDLYIKLGSLTA